MDNEAMKTIPLRVYSLSSDIHSFERMFNIIQNTLETRIIESPIRFITHFASSTPNWIKEHDLNAASASSAVSFYVYSVFSWVQYVIMSNTLPMPLKAWVISSVSCFPSHVWKDRCLLNVSKHSARFVIASCIASSKVDGNKLRKRAPVEYIEGHLPGLIIFSCETIETRGRTTQSQENSQSDTRSG